MISDGQHYAPYRTSLLTVAQLRDLSRIDHRIPMRHALVDWAFIFAAWAIVAQYPTWRTVLPAIVVIGTRYYALAIIGHDGLHRRLFASKERNDLWADLLVFGPICAITRLNRRNHIEHHRTACLPHDPDRHKYLHQHKEESFSYLLFLSGLQNFLPTIKNIFGKDKKRAAHADNGSYSPRDLAIIGGWQLALTVGLTVAIGWWAYPVLWLVPVYMFAYRADLVRVFCEHSMMVPNSEADEHMRLITYTSNWLERQFFAPHKMNYHAAHHLWPSIPYYNLPKADALIRTSLALRGSDENLIWRRSYLSYIASYWLWQRDNRRPLALAQP